MIDTVHIFLSSNFIPAKYFITNNPLVKDIQEIITNQTGEITYNGLLHNLKLRQSQRGLSIKGSLAKYYLNTNQKTLTKQDVTSAFERLSFDLSLPLTEARVNRLDIGENIIVNNSTDQYTELLSNARYFRRLEMSNGLGYENVNRYMSFYDKIKEVKKKRTEEVNQLYQNQHVLRFEYRYMQPATLSRCLKLAKVHVKDVLDNYLLLVQEWYSMFFLINKKKTLLGINEAAFKIKGGFDTQISIIGAEKIGGITVIANLIKTAKKLGFFRYPNEATNLLNKYTTLMGSPRFTKKAPLMEELEFKIKIAFFVNYNQVQ